MTVFWVSLLLTFVIQPRSEIAKPVDHAAIVASVERSLPYLERDGRRWMAGEIAIQDGKSCVSCHHVGYALWTHRDAAAAGVTFPTGPIDALRARARSFLDQADKARVVSTTQMILAGAHVPDDLSLLRSSSTANGYWRARGQFPTQNRSEMESDGAASLWALVALASIEPLDTETQQRRERALNWLAQEQDGMSNEWVAARLIVEHLAGNTTQSARLLDTLLAQQHQDGGWSWLAQDRSNPFSTGQTLYALATVADRRADDSLRRGIAYLLEQQQADGSWKTPSVLTSAEPTEGKDYIYRYWGTAWATLGLTRTLLRSSGAETAAGGDLAADEPTQ